MRSPYILITRTEGVFLCLVLDKVKSNLALARRKVHDVDRELTI